MSDVVAKTDWQAEFDALYADTDDARLPVPRIPWDFIPTTIEDVTLVLAAIQQTRAGCAHRVAQINEMNAVAERLADTLEARHTGIIEGIVRRELAGGKTRSLKLATGVADKPTVVGFRKKPGGLRIVDKEDALKWVWLNVDGPERCEWAPEKVTRAPVADRFKKHFAETGEVPDGCEVVPEADTFYTK